jgi:uncharacterized protein YejL (UPF0352 family)
MPKNKQYCIASINHIYNSMDEVMAVLNNNSTDLSAIVIGQVIGTPETSIKIKKQSNKKEVKAEQVEEVEGVDPAQSICSFCSRPYSAIKYDSERMPFKVCDEHVKFVEKIL